MSTVIVTGSRVWKDAVSLEMALEAWHQSVLVRERLLVHGAAKGADRIAQLWAKRRGIYDMAYPADWERYGKSAGMRRNLEMLKAHPGALVIACPLPGGKGTQGMMVAALKRGMRVQVVSPEGLR